MISQSWFFQIAYDELFFDSVGRDIAKAWSNIQKIFVHVQAAFCHASLGTKIHVDIGNSAHHIENLRTEFSFAQDYADNVVDPILKPLTKDFFENDNSINLVVYLTNNEGMVLVIALVKVPWNQWIFRGRILELIEFSSLCMQLQWKSFLKDKMSQK